MRFHHIGIVSHDIAQSVAFYESLGYACSETFEDPIQNATIIFMHRPDSPLAELIHPLGANSPAYGWVQRLQGSGPYHVCYEVDNLATGIAALRAQRIYPIMKPVPAVAFGMRRVTFLWGKQSGLIELLEGASVHENVRAQSR